ncbi:MAG TPA: hypothetical protein VN973_05025 [Candidatus Dormibacteraeota bacterium]|nr:hypothetical protein [Candidatus Dormibacteraeota bacterium]
MSTTLLYQFALFLHIIGGFGLIAAITVEAIGLRGLRRAAQRNDALVWLGISRGIVMRLAPASLGLILVTGLYMVATAWGPRGWILVALASLLLLGVIGAFGTGLRMARIGPAVGRAKGPLSDELRRTLRDPILLMSLRVRLAMVLGVVLVMTVKPSAGASLLVIVLAIGLGLLAGQIPVTKGTREYRAEAG